jgi:hypothetical protein
LVKATLNSNSINRGRLASFNQPRPSCKSSTYNALTPLHHTP